MLLSSLSDKSIRRLHPNGNRAMWYPRRHGGQAIARILFGDVNPSGHLPISFRSVKRG